MWLWGIAFGTFVAVLVLSSERVRKPLGRWSDRLADRFARWSESGSRGSRVFYGFLASMLAVIVVGGVILFYANYLGTDEPTRSQCEEVYLAQMDDLRQLEMEFGGDHSQDYRRIQTDMAKACW